ncbi:exosortase A [Haliea sp.]|uniref:exosortase A n=1 Tax=Haliea sp. TaxID=1932666 RepID=UPI003527FE2C
MFDTSVQLGRWRQTYSGVILPALYFLAVLSVFHETVMSMVKVWVEGETFAHGFLVLPISLWLIGRQRAALVGQNVNPSPWVIVLTFLGALLWLAGWLVDVNLVQQLALVWIAVTGIWALIGTELAKRIAFPLCFLFLAVPMGEGLIPPLMELTADSTEYLVRLSGIPVYREGMYLTLPTGHWSVVEACSGVRYLIASFTLGLLYAYLSYRSLRTQIIFIVFAILLPVVANSLRAYGIVMIGHLSGMELATGVDHLIYGWVFFGVVMLLLFWVGSFWQEAEPQFLVSESDAGNTFVDRTTSFSQPKVLLLLLLVLIAAPGFSGVFASNQLESAQALQPAKPAPGWIITKDPQWEWLPNQNGADRVTHEYYLGESIVMVGLYQYLNQVPGAELVSSGEAWRIDRSLWRLVKEQTRQVNVGVEDIYVDEAELAKSSEQLRLLVWSFYRVGSEYTANPYRVKVLEAKQVLFEGRRVGSRLFLATPLVKDKDESRRVLENFMHSHLRNIEDALNKK